MKNIILSLVILCASLIASGQNSQAKVEKTPAEIATMRSEQLKIKLNLSEEQKSKIYQIILDEEKEKESNRISRTERAKKNQESIKKVLTPDQLKEFELLKEKRSDARKQHRLKVKGANKTPVDKKTMEK